MSRRCRLRSSDIDDSRLKIAHQVSTLHIKLYTIRNPHVTHCVIRNARYQYHLVRYMQKLQCLKSCIKWTSKPKPDANRIDLDSLVFILFKTCIPTLRIQLRPSRIAHARTWFIGYEHHGVRRYGAVSPGLSVDYHGFHEQSIVACNFIPSVVYVCV